MTYALYLFSRDRYFWDFTETKSNSSYDTNHYKIPQLPLSHVDSIWNTLHSRIHHPLSALSVQFPAGMVMVLNGWLLFSEKCKYKINMTVSLKMDALWIHVWANFPCHFYGHVCDIEHLRCTLEYYMMVPFLHASTSSCEVR